MTDRLVVNTDNDHVVLRELTAEDAPAYFAAVDTNREHLSQFGDETSTKYPDLGSVIDSLEHPSNPNKVRMGIWDGETLVGTINLTPDEDGQTTELGYWLDARHTGHGYATLAAKALSAYARERYLKVYAEVIEGNEKSAKVLEHSGFHETAREAGRLSFELAGTAPERRGSDLDAQIEWVAGEMGYSRDKVKGYKEKLVRLGREPSDATSVFGFMESYWHRFKEARATLDLIPDQMMAYRALQAGAKVVAGLSDKVAFTLWLEAEAENKVIEPTVLIETALESIKKRVIQTADKYTDEQLLDSLGKPFEANPMGNAVLKLHDEYRLNPNNPEILRIIAVEGSAWGILMWQAYSRKLEKQGFSSQMPKPGLSGGNIEPWL